MSDLRRVRLPEPRTPSALPAPPLSLSEQRPPVRSVCLYTCSANPSGMGVHMLALAEQLVRRGVRTTVAYWPAPATEALMARVPRLGAAAVRTPHPRDPAYGAAIEQVSGELRPDVFHVHVGSGRENFGGAVAARRAGVPAVVETLHLPWLLRDPRKRARLHASLEGVDRLIAVSDGLRRTYERAGVPSDRFTTVPNGIVPKLTRLGRAAARTRLGIDAYRPVVMAVGRLAVQKGHVELVHAIPALLDRFPDLAVVIVGEGHLRQRLRQEADRLGVGAALLLPGHCTDAAALLDAADVFVLPSRGEGMPLAALEAMEAGLVTVATRVVGTEEVVDDGRTGFLVPPRNPAKLAATTIRVLEDEVLRRRVGDAARDTFRERFTADRMAARTLAVYAEVLADVPSAHVSSSAFGR